jgi:type II secretory pathway pseudopilin PulG
VARTDRSSPAACGSAKPRARRGFTVVEALAAGVILSAGSVVIGLSVRQGLRALASARQQQTAAVLLDEVFSKVDLVGPEAMLAGGQAWGSFRPPNDGCTWSVGIEPLSTPNLYQVTVRVDWPRVDGSRGAVEAQTLMHDWPGSRPEGLEWDDL